MMQIFEQARTLPGSSRERVMAIGTAYQLYTLKFPEEFDLLIASRTSNIRQKASSKRKEDMEEADQVIHALLRAVIATAIADGSLVLPSEVSVDELCFTLWAMSFGLLVLDQAKEVTSQLQIPPIQQILFRQFNLVLDGYGWTPLSTDQDYLQTLQKIINHLDRHI